MDKEDSSLNRKKNNKIVKYRNGPVLNIGTVLFGVIFVYMIICLVMYVTTDHITAYEVTAGPLAGNYRYNALALRTETIVTADHAGSVSYYVREGSKAGSGTAVCSVNEGSLSASLVPEKVSVGSEKDTTAVQTSTLDEDSLKILKEEMESFSLGFQQENFQAVYNFKGDLESTLLEAGISETFGTDGSSIVNACTAPTEGIVVFSTDGFESKLPESLTASDFEQKNYEKKNLRMNKNVKSGDPIYKLVTEENWYLCILLDQKMATELAANNSVKFRFLKDDTIFYAGLQIQKVGNSYIGILSMDKCMSLYASERYVDIELVLNRKTGLKIPNSAIATKSFYKIPEEFAVYDRETTSTPSEISVLCPVVDKNGTESVKTKTVTVYDKTEDGFLVDCSSFQKGDELRKQNSQKTYTIQETESISGVYNINKGYAVFREITIIDENEEYCIVEAGSTFGLAQYDHIALNADTVNDEDIVIHY